MIIEAQSKFKQQQSKLSENEDVESDQQFIFMRSDDFYVDKSLFISEIFKISYPSLLITRPRRWGKSLNVDMLQTFLQPSGFNYNYYLNYMDHQYNFDLGNENKHLFLGGGSYSELEIANEGKKFISEHLGQFPVIFISMRNLFDFSLKRVQKKLQNIVLQVLQQHEYIYVHLLITIIQKQIYNWKNKELIDRWETKKWLINKTIQVQTLFQDCIWKELRSEVQNVFFDEQNKFAVYDQQDRALIDLFRNRDQITDDYSDILLQIAEYLSYYFQNKQKKIQKNVIIIIDEYDNPLSSGLFEEIQSENPLKKEKAKMRTKLIEQECKQIISIFSKEVKYVKKIIVLGIEKSLILAASGGFNNIKCYPITHTRFLNSFGFNEDDVKYLLSILFHKLNQIKLISTDQFDLIKKQIDQWYNGYKIHNVKKYNPSAIHQHLNHILFEYSEGRSIPTPSAYWLNTGSNEILFSLTKMEFNRRLAQKLIYLSGGGQIKFKYDLNVDQSGDLKQLLLSEPMMVSCLINSGYLTSGEKENYYVIPNREIKQWMIPIIFQYQTMMLFNKTDQQIFINEFFLNFENADSFQVYMQELLDSLKLDFKVNEFYFLCLIQGIFNEADRLDSNNFRASPEEPQFHKKRTDHIFYPKNDTQNCIYIHEYKINKTQEKFLNTQEDAIWQVYANSYIQKVLNEIQTRKYEKVEYIVIRIILFTNLYIDNKWCIRIKEFKHSLEQAKQLNEIFTKNNKLLKDHLVLIKGKLEPKEQFRQKFLCKNQKGDDIYCFLKEFTIQDQKQLINPLSKKKSTIQEKREEFRQEVVHEKREKQFQKNRVKQEKKN